MLDWPARAFVVTFRELPSGRARRLTSFFVSVFFWTSGDEFEDFDKRLDQSLLIAGVTSLRGGGSPVLTIRRHAAAFEVDRRLQSHIAAFEVRDENKERPRGARLLGAPVILDPTEERGAS